MVVPGAGGGGVTTVLTLGTFDLVHHGHGALFSMCRSLAGPNGRVIVAVNTDEFVERFKHRTPVMTVSERMKVVARDRDVDEVIVNDGEDQPRLIESVGPDVIAIGMDWAGKDYLGQLGITGPWLNERRISLIYTATSITSSTTLRNRMGRP